MTAGTASYYGGWATLAPYAAVTARNLVASLARSDQRARRVAHLLTDDDERAERPEDEALRQEEKAAVTAALARLNPPEREILVAHEVHGRDTATLAARQGSTPGAIAARLSRTRAKLRVEYLIAHERGEPPTDRCRPVLLALSAGDRRRQRDLDAGSHLLGCDFCATISVPLLDRHATVANEDEARVSVTTDADVVVARQEGRRVAARAGFTPTELAVIATAISEIARNIVKFAKRGEVVVTVISENERAGVTVVARDVGPGIPTSIGPSRTATAHTGDSGWYFAAGIPGEGKDAGTREGRPRQRRSPGVSRMSRR